MILRDPAYLRFLARWDRDADAVLSALSDVAGRGVRASRRPPPSGATALFGLLGRDPLDAVTQGQDGDWLLPYDPWEVWRAIVEEKWLPPPRAPLHARFPLPYQLVPGPARMALYPLVARWSATPGSGGDPHWPVESRPDRFRETLFRGMAKENPRFMGPRDVAHSSASGSGGEPHSRPTAQRPEGTASSAPADQALGPWPGGRAYPLLFTCDIDTAAGMRCAGAVLDDLVELGLKPCFFLVGSGYRWDEGFIAAVAQAGGEIALHGDRHDNRLAFLPQDTIGRRLDAVRPIIEARGVRGFRSPSLLVSDALYAALPGRFAWDSSVPATDVDTLIGPRRGCGTAFPFRRQGVLVLPTTVPADDRLELLGLRGLDVLRVVARCAAHARAMYGLLHFLVHPEPHLFGQPTRRAVWRAALQETLADHAAWIATPSEVAAYWSGLEPHP